MSSDHDTRAKRDQHGTDAQRDNQVMTDGGDALPSGGEKRDEQNTEYHNQKKAKECQIDLLNGFKAAYQGDLPEDEIDELVEYARKTAREDWA